MREKRFCERFTFDVVVVIVGVVVVDLIPCFKFGSEPKQRPSSSSE